MKEFFRKKETIETLKFIGILIIVFVVINMIITYVPPFNKYDVFTVQTDSMDPIIAPGDIVVTKEINPEDIIVGDIMAFTVDITGDGADDVVVHYIDEINTFNNELIFKTKPHVSELQDRWTLEESDIIGLYQYQINGVGKILLFAQSWVGRIMILIDIIIVSIIYDLLFSSKKKKKDDKPQKETKDNEDSIKDNIKDKKKISTE